MIGITLLYIGAVLLINGMGDWGRVDPRSVAVINFMAGSLTLVIALLLLFRGETQSDFFAVATTFLLAFTYLYVAITTIRCSLMAFQSGDTRFADPHGKLVTTPTSTPQLTRRVTRPWFV